jgi:hypothetical protein
VGSTAMYVATVILFLFPLSILSAAWKGSLVSVKDVERPHWRSHFQKAALIIATFATVMAMAFSLSFTHSGGSPHGLMPPPGLWLTLRPIAMWSVVATIAVAAFGKGKSRLLVVGSAISIFCVLALLLLLQMD